MVRSPYGERRTAVRREANRRTARGVRRVVRRDAYGGRREFGARSALRAVRNGMWGGSERSCRRRLESRSDDESRRRKERTRPIGRTDAEPPYGERRTARRKAERVRRTAW